MAGDGAGTGAGAKNKKFQLCNTAFIPVFVRISVLCFKDVVPVPTCLIMSMPANCLTTLQDTDQAPDPRKIVKVQYYVSSDPCPGFATLGQMMNCCWFW